MDFLIIKTGQRKDGSFWVLIQKEEGDFILTTMIAVKTPKTEGATINIPSSITKNLVWK